MITVIEATKISPRVVLDPNGEMLIQGRSIIENTTVFYKPIIDWVKDVTCSQITVVIKMEYMNTSSSKQLLSVLKTLATNSSIRAIYVKWYYEEDDEDMYDLGKDYESIIHIPFDFYELSGEAA